MLDYLIPSATRRRLLTALYLEGQSGTVSSLARLAQVSTASANAELTLMEEAGLAQRRIVSARRIYEAVVGHAHADTVRALLQLPEGGGAGRRAAPSLVDDPRRVRRDLAVYGAPLAGARVATRTKTPLELALARGVVLSREDTEVARAMPALFIQHRGDIDFARLGAHLHELRHKHTGGFLLALAGQLAGNRRLTREAEQLRDHRRSRPVHFFSPRKNPELATDEHTLPLALQWHFHFPLPLADFPTP